MIKDCNPAAVSQCFITGLPIRKKKEWTDCCVGEDYKISCTLIGENILLSQPCGRSTIYTTKAAVDLFAQIVSELFPDGRPYIQIEDFSQLISHTFEGRKYYINSMQNNKQIAGLIFFGTSPILTTSVKLGKRLSLVKFNVDLCKDYPSAIRLANQLSLKSIQKYKNRLSNENRGEPSEPSSSKRLELDASYKESEADASLTEQSARSDSIDKGNISDGYKNILPSWAFKLFKARNYKFDKKMQILMDELLTSISAISWDSGYENTNPPKIDSNHPFWPIFESVSIIKKDIDQLFHEREVADKTLKESEKKYRTIIESFEDGYYEVDLKGDFTFVNQAMSKITGYVKQELIGSNYRVHAGKRTSDKLFKTFNRVFNSGRPVSNHEFQIITNNNRHKYVEISISLIQPDNAAPTGFCGTMRDIDARKKAEKEKRELEIKLLQSQKMEALGRLAGGVAHDLNNVLSGVINYPELMLLNLPEDSPLRKPLKKILKSGQKAAAIVQDLLTLARRAVIQPTVLNLNDIVREYFASPEHLKLIEENDKTTIATQLDENLANMRGSAIHLFKTVMNLIYNAAEAMVMGGEINIASQNVNVDNVVDVYGKRYTGEFVRLTITDEGSGIDENDIPHIFEPFYTKKVMGRSGTGLGMAVVWGTVQDHNGFIRIESQKNDGTIIYIYFPATGETIGPVKDVVDIQNYRGAGETVMVIDDVAEQREIAREMLTNLNYSVVCVESGEQALEFLQNHSVDIILLDMIMEPGMDGYDTFREIIKMNPNQKTLITSGFSDSRKVRAAQNLGAGNYLKKPYSIELLGLELKSALEK